MPEHADRLSDYLDDARRRSLRELFSDYRVTMVSCVYFRNRAPWHVPLRRCSDGFFLFPTLGRFRASLDSGRVEVAPGQFLMLLERERHALEIVEGGGRLHQVSVHCHIHDRWGRPLLFGGGQAVGRLPVRDHFLEALKELTCLMARDPETGQRRGEALLKELLAFQLRHGASFPPLQTTGDPRVGRVLQRMEQEFASPALSIEALSGEAGITSVQLRKLFRRETGVGPKHFLNRLRLRKAAHFLRQTALGVKQVAAECGFASDHYFHLAFRKEYGCTPTGYRSRAVTEV